MPVSLPHITYPIADQTDQTALATEIDNIISNFISSPPAGGFTNIIDVKINTMVNDSGNRYNGTITILYKL